MAHQPEKLISDLIAEDPEMIDIVMEFVGDLPERIHTLQDAWRAADWERLTMFAHQLKGAGGSYGYPQISQAAAALEHESRSRCADRVDEMLDALESLSAAARAGLTPE